MTSEANPPDTPADAAYRITDSWPDDTNIVRGGAENERLLKRRRAPHPAYSNPPIAGWSVQSKPAASVDDLASVLPHERIRVTTLGMLRASGGRLAKTVGGYEHCTVTEIDASTFDRLLSIPRTRIIRVR